MGAFSVLDSSFFLLSFMSLNGSTRLGSVSSWCWPEVINLEIHEYVAGRAGT